jgi:hypothetical protein
VTFRLKSRQKAFHLSVLTVKEVRLSARRHSTHSFVYLHLTANTFLSVGMSSTSCHSLIVTLHTVDALTRLGKDEL